MEERYRGYEARQLTIKQRAKLVADAKKLYSEMLWYASPEVFAESAENLLSERLGENDVSTVIFRDYRAEHPEASYSELQEYLLDLLSGPNYPYPSK